MSFKDLRSFLDVLESQGQLVRFSEPILPEPAITDIDRAIGSTGPAVLMDNIIGYKGRKVVTGVHGPYANWALMFGLPKNMSLREQIVEVSKIWDCYDKGSVVWVDNPPCQEVIIEEDAVNLFEIIPVYRVNPLDGGFYLAKASCVTRETFNPDDFGAQNVGIYRLQIQGPREIGINMSAMHDIGEHYAQAQAMGRHCPIAICLGVDPILTMMASTPIKYDESEYLYTSGLMGAPYELTKTIGYNLDVPANAEFVIEGEILGDVRFPEGPFGEFPASYSGINQGLRIRVDRVTHRFDPIFDTLSLGGRASGTGSNNLTHINTCVELYKQLTEEFPEVKAVNATHQHGMTTIVATDQRHPGHAKTIAMRLASTPHGTDYCRNIIMVDGFIDPFNLTEVIWALSTRVRANVDVIEIPCVPGVPLIPAIVDPPLDRKLIIDATTPVPPDRFRPAKLIDISTDAQDFGATIRKLHAKAKEASTQVPE